MNFSLDDVIAAQATPHGNGRRGMIRLSGPSAFSLIEKFLLFPVGSPLQNDENRDKNVRRMNDLRQKNGLHQKDAGETSRACPGMKPSPELDFTHPFIRRAEFDLWGPDRAVPIHLWFWPDGRGYTGQETVEFHLPGSPAILDAVLDRLCGEEKIRLARPGEFTLRSFLSGRLDLTQAEAVLGVIDAEDDSTLETALAQLAGNLRNPLRTLRENLLETLAHLEAGFDFVEEDIEFISARELSQKLGDALWTIQSKLDQMESRTDSRSRGRVILIGVPNSGKSALFNRLVRQFGSEKSPNGPAARGAIVSEVAGTTRDYLEAEIEIDRHPVLLTDTAGIEPSGNSESSAEEKKRGAVSKIGGASSETDSATLRERIQNQSRSAAENADLFLLCIDTRRLKGEKPTDWERERFASGGNSKPTRIVLTKEDLVSFDPAHLHSLAESWGIPPESVTVTSTVTGKGIDRLSAEIGSILFGDRCHSEIVPATAVRCREALRTAADSIRRGKTLVETGADEVLTAVEIRTALDQLGLVLGTVQTDDILDRIFSRFCVGK